ncbi:MAG: hypothetical protein COV99_02445 [Bacteroidetes bacterium CG12_big_fil_rev_8_21_14_0_65_60_17]|nr:MAG: hypothetical protein COV99_02445 [Bacteroidetes bacterium CG12_big_fil_rev_8_21_14_0_65_60_17]
MKPTLATVPAAVVLSLTGIVTLFAPEILLSNILGTADATHPLVSMLGGLMLAFGYMNWMGRNAILGGIYGKPLVMGNLLHGIVGTTSLLDLVTQQSPLPAWGLLAFYVWYTVSYGILMTRPPWKPEAS